MRTMNKFLAAALLTFSFGATAAPSVTLDDPKIAKVHMTINTGETNLAKDAKDMLQNKEVQEFNEMMFDHHTKNNVDLAALLATNAIVPEDSDYATNLENSVNKTRQDLGQVDRASYDKTYLQYQVALHQTALKIIDEELLPQIQDPEFKTFVTQTREVVNTHLLRAQELLAQM